MKKVYYEFLVIMRKGKQAFSCIKAESMESAREKIRNKYKVSNSDISFIRTWESEG